MRRPNAVPSGIRRVRVDLRLQRLFEVAASVDRITESDDDLLK